MIGVLLSTRFLRFPMGYVGLYPYLGEGSGVGEAADRVFDFAVNRFLKRGDMHSCSSRVDSRDSIAYVYCFTVDEKITLPMSSNEKLEMTYYLNKIRDFRRIWNYSIHVTFHLSEDVVQGVYKSRGFDSYYFAAFPGLPICTKSEGLEEIKEARLLTLVKVYINGEEVKFRILPGMIYESDIKYPQCFDIVSMSFRGLASGNLREEAYKPLMSIKRETEVTYVVEIYVDEQLLDKNATIYVSIGPPYIIINQE
ncbi:MAG: hypothetical protein QXQ57_00475 [Sulfolobales archaeon]